MVLQQIQQINPWNNSVVPHHWAYSHLNKGLLALPSSFIHKIFLYRQTSGEVAFAASSLLLVILNQAVEDGAWAFVPKL